MALAIAVWLGAGAGAMAQCDIDRTPCKGCGCQGGPGYREIITKRCVGFRDLPRRCGEPPSPALCVFENAPGTGANRECALAPRSPRQNLDSPAKPVL